MSPKLNSLFYKVTMVMTSYHSNIKAAMQIATQPHAQKGSPLVSWSANAILKCSMLSKEEALHCYLVRGHALYTANAAVQESQNNEPRQEVAGLPWASTSPFFLVW